MKLLYPLLLIWSSLYLLMPDNKALNLDKSSIEQVKIINSSYILNNGELNDIDIILKDSTLRWKKIPEEGFSKPYNNASYWLHYRIYIPNNGVYHLVNNYTMLEKLELYTVDDLGQTNYYGNLGIESPNTSIGFTFPAFNVTLNKGFYDFYILEYKRFSTASQNIQLLNNESFIDFTYQYQFWNGLIYGIFLFLFVQGLITFYLFRVNKYLIYCVYLICLVVIYGVSEGSYRLIFPYEWHKNIYFMLYFAIAGSFCCLFLLFLLIVPVKKHIPLLPKLLFYVFGFTLCLLVVNNYAFLYIPNFPLWVFKLSNLLFILFPLSLLLLSLYFYFKYKYKQALWLVVLFVLTLFFIIVFSLLPFLGIRFSMFMKFKWLIIFEGIAVLVILYKDFYVLSEEKKQLQLSLSQEQFNSAMKYIAGVSEERERIASQLHDDVSLSIALLKKNIQNHMQNNLVPSESLYIQLGEIQEKIRRASHSIYPVFMEHVGLKEAIESEIQKIEDFFPDIIVIPDITLQESITDKKIEKIIYLTFLELIQNVLKFSKCTEVKIFLYKETNAIILVVEDNGIGYDFSGHFNEGIGLRTIKNRAVMINGSFEVILLNPGVKNVFCIPLSI